MTLIAKIDTGHALAYFRGKGALRSDYISATDRSWPRNIQTIFFTVLDGIEERHYHRAASPGL